MGNRRFDTDFIQKQMKFLNLFINNVAQIEDFKASEILNAFLSYTNRGKFESKFKEYQSQVLSGYVEDYKTLEGKVATHMMKEMKVILLILINFLNCKNKL